MSSSVSSLWHHTTELNRSATSTLALRLIFLIFRVELTGQGRVEFVAKEALPLLSFLVELATSIRYDSVPHPDMITVIKTETIKTQIQKCLSEHCKTNNARLYLSPILIESSGEQEIVSGQSGDLCCLLSRNQPESTRPRTWASAPSCDSWLATRSIFNITPIPPALEGSQEKQEAFSESSSSRVSKLQRMAPHHPVAALHSAVGRFLTWRRPNNYSTMLTVGEYLPSQVKALWIDIRAGAHLHSVVNLTSEHQAVKPTHLEPDSMTTLACFIPLGARSLMTSRMIRDPMKAYSAEKKSTNRISWKHPAKWKSG